MKIIVLAKDHREYEYFLSYMRTDSRSQFVYARDPMQVCEYRANGWIELNGAYKRRDYNELRELIQVRITIDPDYQ